VGAVHFWDRTARNDLQAHDEGILAPSSRSGRRLHS
jgi:hypothetical protein